MTSYPSFLLEVGDHDDNANVLLPDHPPEVFPARSEGSLSCDVGPGSLVTLHKTPPMSPSLGVTPPCGKQTYSRPRSWR